LVTVPPQHMENFSRPLEMMQYQQHKPFTDTISCLKAEPFLKMSRWQHSMGKSPYSIWPKINSQNDCWLTPSVVGLSLECRTVRASFLSSCRHLNPLCQASVARPERFRALSPACTVLSRKISVLHLPLNEFTHEMLHLLFVLCIYCL
jgi:hypothetical protein